MNTMIYITTILLVATKFLDCYSTNKGLTIINMETNPIARKIMNCFGKKNAIWTIFFLALIIITICSYTAIIVNSAIYKISFIILGLLISLIQLSVAITNFGKKYNTITKQIYIFHKILEKFLK